MPRSRRQPHYTGIIHVPVPVRPHKAGTAYPIRCRKLPGPFTGSESVGMDIPDEHVADFDKWYDEELIPHLSEVPGWVRTRRFVLDCGVVCGTDESLRPVGGAHRLFALALCEWEAAPGGRDLERLGGVQGFNLGPVSIGVQEPHRD